MKDKNVLITGGAGFIGSNIAHGLVEDNLVTVLDNFQTGKRENIESLLSNKNFTLIEGSITDPDAVRNAVRGKDYVFHHAARASITESIENPLPVNEVNLAGTMNVIMESLDAGAKMVFASSSSVYGNVEVMPISEDIQLYPLSPYATQKLCGEWYLRNLSELRGLRCVSLRYFNVYGPRQDPGSQYSPVVPKFITRALAGGQLSIFGDGGQTRDFVFIKDVVKANILAAESSVNDGTAINVGSATQISINTLAEEINGIIGNSAGVTYEPPREGEGRDSKAEITRARELLGFEPSYSVKDGLAETIEFYRAAL